MSIFVLILLLLNAGNVFGTLLNDSKVALAIPVLALYFLIAGAAHWLDRKRV